MKIRAIQIVHQPHEVDIEFPAYASYGSTVSRVNDSGLKVNVCCDYVFADKWNVSISFEHIDLTDMITNPDYTFGLGCYRGSEKKFNDTLDRAFDVLLKLKNTRPGGPRDTTKETNA